MPTSYFSKSESHFYPRPPRGGRRGEPWNPRPSWSNFYPRPPRGGRRYCRFITCSTSAFLSTPSAGRATWVCVSFFVAGQNFYPRPPRGGRRLDEVALLAVDLFLSTPSAGRATGLILSAIYILRHFYPRPPRGGRPPSVPHFGIEWYISIHALRGEGDGVRPELRPRTRISIHALRGEGDEYAEMVTAEHKIFLSTPSAGRATRQKGHHHRGRLYFYPRPPRGGRHWFSLEVDPAEIISIHALRGEGDSKNGEKHLRFCFIIKRSAQIWKSLSKNIRKKSRDLHRTA